jgi:membrane fusion protein (multidrug efflux system)
VIVFSDAIKQFSIRRLRAVLTMKKRIIFASAGLVILIAILGAVKALQIGKMIDQGKKFEPPPETVTSIVVKADSWETALTAVGTMNAVQGVTVSAELSGKVVKIAFEPGTQVQKGQVLLHQDISSEEAQLLAPWPR